MPPDATLATLAAAGGGRVVGDGTVRVADVHHDSGDVTPGSLFVAVRGLRTDGHRYVPAAIAAGAAAVCVEQPLDATVPQLVVPDTRAALGPLAAAVHGHPSDRLTIVGVTGTNGKTTVVHFLEAIATAAGLTAGAAGTLGTRIAGRAQPQARTTPEATDFQRLLAAMADAGVDVAAVEVSSHALRLGRVAGTRFAVGAFTNLSQDHLDFHHDMDDYFAAKASLFEPARVARAVVWVDDPWGARLAGRLAVPVTTVGLAGGDVHAEGVAADFDGSSFTVVTPGGSGRAEIRLPGGFNVANALVAAACAQAVGIDLDAVAAGLAAVPRVAGRMEAVRRAGGPEVIVDYAHTPAGVAAAIATARELGGGRVVAVVGAGGDRDQAKRPAMGRAAASADLAVVTNDNPRSEPPEAIIAAVVEGARQVAGAHVLVEADRRLAIRTALARAGEGDVVLVLGKGHEPGQDFGDRVEPFDDVAVAREELERKVAGRCLA